MSRVAAASLSNMGRRAIPNAQMINHNFGPTMLTSEREHQLRERRTTAAVTE